MTRLIQLFSALGTFALTSIAEQPIDNGLATPSTFEMDFIFPQNETYKNSDVFPIVLVVQNVSALQTALSATEKAQNLTAGYLRPQAIFHIDAYRENGRLPGYTGLVTEYINFTDAVVTQPPDKGDYAIFASVVNMTDILKTNSGKVGLPEYRYVVTYYVQMKTASDEIDKICQTPLENSRWSNAGLARMIFNIDRPQLENYLRPDQLVQNPIAVDIMKSIPESPAYGSLVDILPSTTATDTCPVYFEGHYKRGPGPSERKDRATPCALKVDRPILSAISSQVERLTAPTTTAEVSTSTSTGAASLATGWANPMQTALAAACVLCGLAL